jgi:hypothetical protein
VPRASGLPGHGSQEAETDTPARMQTDKSTMKRSTRLSHTYQCNAYTANPNEFMGLRQITRIRVNAEASIWINTTIELDPSPIRIEQDVRFGS